MLRSNGLALVQSSVKDVYQIVGLADVRPFAPVTDEFGRSTGTYATGIFPVENVTPDEAKTYIEKFLYTNDDKAKENITTVPNRNLLIVTETGDRLLRIKQLLESVEQPKPAVFRSFYELENLQAIELKQQLDEIFGSVDVESAGGQSPVGDGCKECRQTGYQGRIGIFEFMTIDEAVRSLIQTRSNASEIREASRTNDMKLLREDELEKIVAGQTTIEEVVRVSVDSA